MFRLKTQCLPLIQGVGEGLPNRAFGEDVGLLFLEPVVEGIQYRDGLQLTSVPQGKRSGNSFHCAPCLRAQTSPSKHARESARGRPPAGEGGGLSTKSLIKFHWASVRKGVGAVLDPVIFGRCRRGHNRRLDHHYCSVHSGSISAQRAWTLPVCVHARLQTPTGLRLLNDSLDSLLISFHFPIHTLSDSVSRSTMSRIPHVQ